MRTLLAALFLTACSSPTVDEQDFIAEEGGEMLDGLRIPASITLTPGSVFVEPLVAGQPSRVAVFASPGVRADLYVTAAGPGAGPCPSTLGGTCLGLKGKAIRLGTGIAASSGPATSFTVFTIVPPAGFSGQVWLQGFVRQGTSPALKGPVLSASVTLRAPVDTDGDGLSDTLEAQIGTSALDADSDNDGLTDFFEHLVLGTSPILADTDNDGLRDGDEEQVYSTDPLDDDSDDDTVRDGDEIALGSNPFSGDTDGDGLSDGDEVALGTSLLLADTDGDTLSDLQEVNQGTSPILADTDTDGLSDAEEQTLGTNPLLIDTDGDGLSDTEAEDYGTDALDVDSDDDGWDDGVEVANGWDPLDGTDTDGDGIPDDQEGTFGTSPTDDNTDGDDYRDGDELFSGFDPTTPQSSYAVRWRAPVSLSIWEDTAAQFPPGVQGATGTLTVSWTAPGVPMFSDAASATYALTDSLMLDLTGFTLTHTNAFGSATVYDAISGGGGAVTDGISSYIPVNTVVPAVTGIAVVRWNCFTALGDDDVYDSTRLPLTINKPGLGCAADMFIDNGGTASYAFVNLLGPYVLVP